MPNHVTNILVVTGDEDQRQAMFEAVKQNKYGLGSLDFNKVIHTPGNIYHRNPGEAECAKYGKNNWLDWNLSNWGTKWNSYGYHVQTAKEFDGSTLTFDTAGSRYRCGTSEKESFLTVCALPLLS